jgi:hypothetical protein
MVVVIIKWESSDLAIWVNAGFIAVLVVITILTMGEEYD